MASSKSIGVIELSSVGIGYQIQDEMLKAASVELLIARTICSGKYLIVIGGSVSDVEAAVEAGLTAADDAISVASPSTNTPSADVWITRHVA